MSGDVLTTWSEKFLDADTVFFQIISLGEATYVWVGHEDARLDSLALGVPSPLTPTAAGTTLLGSGADPASKSMAQRLAKKLAYEVADRDNKPRPSMSEIWKNAYYSVRKSKSRSPTPIDATG